jgi:hypothetical protein
MDRRASSGSVYQSPDYFLRVTYTIKASVPLTCAVNSQQRSQGNGRRLGLGVRRRLVDCEGGAASDKTRSPCVRTTGSPVPPFVQSLIVPSSPPLASRPSSSTAREKTGLSCLMITGSPVPK